MRTIKLLVIVDLDKDDDRTAEQVRSDTQDELGGPLGPEVRLLANSEED